MDLDSNGDLYIGYGSVLKRRLKSSGVWETISSNIGATITDLKYNHVDDRIYIVLYSSSNNIKYYDIQQTGISTLPTVTNYPRGIAFDSNNNIFVGVQSPTVYQGSVQKYDSSGETWENVFNHQNVSGILDIEIDSNDNIFCFANAGSLTVGVSPYQAGDWEPFSNTTSITYSGPSLNEETGDEMDFKVGDSVCLVEMPSQQGVVIRLNPLRVKNAAVVKWTSGGPMYPMDNLRAYFTNELQKLELM